MDFLTRDDPRLAALVTAERRRLETTLDLIAAENHAPPSIMEVQGSVLQTKTIEGYPGRRFHAGCVNADCVERLAVDRACRLFGCEHANVQPNSGTAANLAVYFAVLDPGDRILSMRLAHGGHLSHGHRASITSRCFRFAHYGLDPATERIDYPAARRAAREFRPRMIVAGASAYPRAIDYGYMAEIAREVGAFFFVDMAHIAGLVAADVLPSPVPHADFVTFTSYKTLAGGRGGIILCRREHAAAVDRAVFPGCQGTSAVHLIAAKALAFHLASTPAFADVQRRTVENAVVLADELERRGYRIVSGGTENHQVLVDVAGRGVNAGDGEQWLERAGIVVNRNVLPADAGRPGQVSGLRLGTAAVSSRAMGPVEMAAAAEWIDRVLAAGEDPDLQREVSGEVAALCMRFPVYARSGDLGLAQK